MRVALCVGTGTQVRFFLISITQHAMLPVSLGTSLPT